MITKENPKIKEHPEQQTHDSLYIMEVVKTIKNIVIEECYILKDQKKPTIHKHQITY